MDCTIQRLDIRGHNRLRELNSIFSEAFDDAETYANDLPSDTYLATFLSNAEHIVLVATINDKVVGGLVGYTLTKFEMERTEIYVYDLAVSPDYQRHGIGRGLIKYLKTIARDSGAYVVFVQADEGDDAIKFYESLSPTENIRARNFDFLT